MLTPNRQLIYDYLDLPTHVQVGIMRELGVYDPKVEPRAWVKLLNLSPAIKSMKNRGEAQLRANGMYML